jgi:hypothetical protein
LGFVSLFFGLKKLSFVLAKNDTCRSLIGRARNGDLFSASQGRIREFRALGARTEKTQKHPINETLSAYFTLFYCIDRAKAHTPYTPRRIAVAHYIAMVNL